MDTMFDFLAVVLFIASVGVFFHRFRHEDPPLAPYMLVGLVAAVGNWLGNNGGGWAAVCVLSGGAFFLLQLAGAPYTDDGEERQGG